MTPGNAAHEAQELFALMPTTYQHGALYPVEYRGRQIRIGFTRGRGRNSGGWYLHVAIPVTRVIKSPTGEILDKGPGTAYYRIRLFDDNAAWKEV